MTKPNASTSVSTTDETSSKNTATKKSETTKKAAKEKTHHPPTSEMVNAAISALNEKRGSSLQAIKKYITATYNIDAEKHAVYIRKYLKEAVVKNQIIQTRGIGANGSFKLADNIKEKKKRGRNSASKKATDSDSAEEMDTVTDDSTVKSTPATK